MTRPPVDTQKPSSATPEKPAEVLSHQERVYFEMFRAIEQLGRKLEKAEAERFILARRLSDIEDSAERDENTGRLYLPAKIETAAPPPPAAQRLALPAALASLVLALLTLGVVMMQDLPQSSAPQMVRSGAPDPSLAALRAGEALPRSGWHQRTEPAEVVATVETPAPQLAAVLPEGIETQAVALETLAAASPQIEMLPAPVAAAEENDGDDFDMHLADALDDLHAEETAADTASVADLSAPALALTEPSADEGALDALPPAPAVIAPVATEQKPAPVQATSVQSASIPSASQTPKTASPMPLMRDTRLPAPLAALEARAFDGLPEAQHDLATLYAEGRRVRQDYARARAWFTRAAAAGIANAHYNLGVMSQRGLGLAADAAAAEAHYEKAALLGHPEAMYNLGLLHAEGRGANRSPARAASYFKRAANAGMVQAAYNLGVLYESEALGKPDIAAAIEWYEVAAGEGNRDAALAVRRLTRQRAQQATAR